MTNLTPPSGGKGLRRPNRHFSVRAAEPPRQFVMPNIPWNVSPEELSQPDADIVRNIAGEVAATLREADEMRARAWAPLLRVSTRRPRRAASCTPVPKLMALGADEQVLL